MKYCISRQALVLYERLDQVTRRVCDMSMIENDWLPAMEAEFKKPYYRQLYSFIKEEYSKTVVYPPADDIFNAFHFTPLSEVKVRCDK